MIEVEGAEPLWDVAGRLVILPTGITHGQRRDLLEDLFALRGDVVEPQR